MLILQFSSFQKQIFLTVLFISILSVNSVASVNTDIKANNSDSLLTVADIDQVSVVISLDKGDLDGINADWWVVASTPMGWYHYDLSGSWKPGLVATHQGPIFDLADYKILNAKLPAGSYTFYFGIDTVTNGQLDLDEIFFDSVPIKIDAIEPADPMIGTWVDQASGFTIVITEAADDYSMGYYYSGKIYYHKFIGGVVNVSGYDTDYANSIIVRGKGQLDYDAISNGADISDVYKIHSQFEVLLRGDTTVITENGADMTTIRATLDYKKGTNIITGGLSVTELHGINSSTNNFPISLVKQ